MQVARDEANDNRPLKEYVVPSNEGPYLSIFFPSIADKNFKLKPSLYSMEQQN